jgi:hypothetical protein
MLKAVQYHDAWRAKRVRPASGMLCPHGTVRAFDRFHIYIRRLSGAGWMNPAKGTVMKLNMRTLAVSVLSSGLIALGSSVAIAQSVNNIDNTSPGESGHGTGCSNVIGGCRASEVSTAHGAYQPTNDLGAAAAQDTNTNASSTTPSAPAPYVGCMPASEATPGHCITGGTNK